MFRKLRKGQRGFTLVELLVTIAILGTLFGIVTLALNDISTSSTTALEAAELAQVQSAADIYLADSYPTTVVEQTVAGPATSGATFAGFMRQLPSTYCYTWTTDGSVTQAACP